jgi:hypothetical protein
MLSVTVAAVVATVLFMLFRSTRALGIVGVFVLVAISPIVFGGLVLLTGLVYYLAFMRPACEVIRPDDAKRRRNDVFLIAALGVGGALALGYMEPTSESAASKILGPVRAAPRAEVIVLRTPGGLLEVSSIHATEVFDATVKHTVLGVDIGETMPRIRLPAVYRYHVELTPEWRVVRADGVFTIVAPRIRPTLPVAVDLAGIEKDVAGTWMLVPFTGTKDLDRLERSITDRLAQKARSRDYIDRQRDDARETVREFARKWLVEQTRWKSAKYEDVRVLFEDEPAGAIPSVVI